MTAQELSRLRNGDRVRHVDGTVGVLVKFHEYESIFQIDWDDNQQQLLRIDSPTDIAWAETDLTLVTE